MSFSKLNFNIYSPLPAPSLSDSKCSITDPESSTLSSYKGNSWINVPAITNILYAPYEAVLATAALVHAFVTGDEEGKLDATLRLGQQPVSFLSAISSLFVSTLETGVVKSLRLKSYIPVINIAASSLGLPLCAIELFLESLGARRALSFLRQFCSPASIYPSPCSEHHESEQLKEELTQRICSLIAYLPTIGEKLNPEAGDKLKTHLYQLLHQLTTSGSLSPELHTDIEALLHAVSNQLLLADLHRLRNKYLSISSQEMKKIATLVKRQFPHLSPLELEDKKEEAICQTLLRKRNALARRVQPWFVQELDRKLKPLTNKLEHSDAMIQLEGQKEAQQLMEEMHIQAKKKIVAHLIGIAGILTVAAGLIAAMTACPYLIPLTLISVGGAIAIGRYYFSLGYWNSHGWHFDISACIPSPIKWVYNKIAGLTRFQEKPHTYQLLHHPAKKHFSLADIACYLPPLSLMGARDAVFAPNLF